MEAEGFYLRFRLASAFGDIEAEGRTVLRTRLSEIDALARLDEVSKGEVFARAAGGALLRVGTGVVSAARAPGATAKGIGGGLKRFGVNLGRKAKRAADSVTKDDKKPEAPERSSAERARDAAGGAARALLGVNAAARRWAQKLGVDPYTTNPVLRDALVDVAEIDAAGGIAAKVVVPLPTLVTATASVGELVWAADPEELRKTNEARLRELGASDAVAGRFFVNGNFTLTSQTRLVAALHGVSVPGAADYVDAAAEAEDEREALFFVESAEMLAGLHARRPVSAVLPDSRTLVARCGPGAVALLPFDTLRWTARLATASLDLAERARAELGARTLEARLVGTATERARRGLAASGWRLEAGVIAGLLVPPAD